MEGWIKVHRAILNKPIWKDSTMEQKVILITLLLMASHKENEWEFKGEKYTIQPGQFITSLKSIAENAGAGISIKNVRTALARFEKYEFLANESTNKNRLITIINWGLYQSNDDEGGKQTGKQLASNRQAGGNYQECKECKEDNKEVVIIDNARARANEFSPFNESEINALGDNANGQVYDFYQSNFGMLSPYLSQQLGNWIDDMSADIVILAMEQSLKNNVRKFSYANSILNYWHSQGARTVEQCQALINEFEERRGSEQYAKRKEGSEAVRHGGDQTESGRSKSPFAFLDEESRVWTGRGKWGNAAQMSEMQGRGGFSDPL